MQCNFTSINITQQLVSTCDNGHDIPIVQPKLRFLWSNSGDDNRISDFTQRARATASNNNRERCQLVRTWRVSNLSHHHFQLYTSHYLHLDSSLEFKADKFRINFHPIRLGEREKCVVCVLCVRDSHLRCHWRRRATGTAGISQNQRNDNAMMIFFKVERARDESDVTFYYHISYLIFIVNRQDEKKKLLLLLLGLLYRSARIAEREI